MDEIIGQLRILHNKQICGLYKSSVMVEILKS